MRPKSGKNTVSANVIHVKSDASLELVKIAIEQSVRVCSETRSNRFHRNEQ